MVDLSFADPDEVGNAEAGPQDHKHIIIEGGIEFVINEEEKEKENKT